MRLLGSEADKHLRKEFEMAEEKSQPTTWSDLAISLYDKLTGRHAEISYEFNDLEIFVPVVASGESEHVKWKLNGTVKIRTREAT